VASPDPRQRPRRRRRGRKPRRRRCGGAWPGHPGDGPSGPSL